MLGLRELVVIALVTLVLYGRSGVTTLRGERARTILPWLSPVRRRPGARPARAESNRLFWFWTILAATAVTVWIVTRTLISSGAAP